VAAVRGGGIHADLALRDFTVNAMAVPLTAKDLIDPFGGLAHLRERRLVAVSGHIFSDDPLRLMRAPRFCHVLGLRLDPALADSVREQGPGLSAAAAERVTTEMTLTFGAGRAAEAVRLWRDLGLLAVVLPEVSARPRLEPTLALLEALDSFLERPAAWFPETAALLGDRLAEDVDGTTTRPVALRLAGLMHRMAVGEAEAAGRRLKLSGSMLSLLRAVSRQSPAGLGDGPAASGWAAGSKRAAVLFLWSAAPWEPEVITLAAATAGDGGGGGLAGPGAEGDRLDPARHLLALWAERTVHGVPRPPVDGVSLMRELGLEAGPLLGKALREARLAWEAGEATTADEALTAARSALAPG
jgi:poly(A) polymerase